MNDPVLYLYFMLQWICAFNFLVFLSITLSLRSGKMGLSHEGSWRPLWTWNHIWWWARLRL